MTRKRRQRRLIALLIGLLIFCEPAARFVYAHQPPRPAAFRQSFSVHWADGYWQTDDYTSEELNVENGERRTVGQPEHYQHTVWFYGNSLTFGFNVSDEDTIASQLQRLTSYRVVNRSAIGQALRGSYAWLRVSPLQAGDVVVFGGHSDTAFAEKHSKPVAGWIWAECDKPEIARLSVTAMAVVCQYVPTLPSDPVAYQRLMADYYRTLADVQAYLQARGVGFINLAMLKCRVSDDDYVDIYGHYNRHGAAVVARQMYDAMTLF